jgi:SAM-dependent methyltransferase
LIYLLQKSSCTQALSILDVGCSICDLLIFSKLYFGISSGSTAGVNLFPLNKKVFAREEIVNDLFGDGKKRIKYCCLDIEKREFPFPDESFDVVFFVDVLEHLYDPIIALKEIRRVLKPGGYLCLKTPNCANLKNRIKLLFGKSPLHNIDGWLLDDRYFTPSGETKFQGHIREYTLEELKKILKCYGFDSLLIHFHPTEYYPHRILLKSYNFFEYLFPGLNYEISIIATKSS